MCTYVYYAGKIYTAIKLRKKIESVNGYDICIEDNKLTYKKWYQTDFNAGDGEVVIHSKDCMEFDAFEDIIEVGDLVLRYSTDTGKYYYSVITDLDYVSDDKHLVLEIYKHIGKDFIRVCHKENNEWRID